MSKKGVVVGASIITVGVTTGVVISHLITKGLIQVAIGRNLPPKLEKQQSKITRNERINKFQECITETGKALLEKDIEKVEISSRDGLFQ